MAIQKLTDSPVSITQFEQLAELADYSLLDTLKRDPEATADGMDHRPRQVFSGHYVPVKPTPLPNPEYVSHSKGFFRELGLDDSLAASDEFMRFFSGDLSVAAGPMRDTGWATGYALSIFGTEYTEQCPFRTGNGYGDGRAISVLEAEVNGQRWEMQLKGAGPTPYCRGADGRAVLRSSVREFLAQDHMHALGVPTSRSLSLFVSTSERVYRPWYTEGSHSENPDIMVSNPVAISTRVAPSFLRVGQLELFGRRARNNAHPEALKELEMIVLHAIDREYKSQIPQALSLAEKCLQLATEFRERLTSLVANWLRVGYCQGNFNSDNTAIGGYTLDYGPFGFCERFDPFYQPWTGGGRHFSFFNQPLAADKNFEMFCTALQPLLQDEPAALEKLAAIREGFGDVMQQKLDEMWAAKLGLASAESDFVIDLLRLMVETKADYTVFFRELSNIPDEVSGLNKSFYSAPSKELNAKWHVWLTEWRAQLDSDISKDELSDKMKQVNPKYTWREWLVVPAYEAAMQGDYSLVETLQGILTDPYGEQSQEVEDKYYQLRPQEYFLSGGVSHYSCSS